MPRDGSNIYSKPAGTTAVASTTIESAKFNSVIDDIATDLNVVRPIVAGGTGAASAPAALTALGAQPLDANLTSLAGLTFAANKGLYTTAADTAALFDLTAAGRAILDDADNTAQRATLGLVIGTDVQAFGATLTNLEALSLAQGDLLYATAADTLTRLPKGTAGQVLAMNTGATAPEWIAAPTSRVWLATRTAAASPTLDFTEYQNSIFRRYEYELEDVLLSVDGANLCGRTSTNAGVSYDSGASDYAYALTEKGSGAESDANDSLAASLIVLAVSSGNAAGEQGISGFVYIWGPGATARTTVRTLLHSFDSSDGSINMTNGSGVRLANQDTDAFRFIPNTGVITSGTVSMYGII